MIFALMACQSKDSTPIVTETDTPTESETEPTETVPTETGTPPYFSRNVSEADFILYGSQANRKIGQVILADDTNADGFDDLILGVPQLGVEKRQGFVALLNGRPDVENLATHVVLTSQNLADGAGLSVALLQDLNADTNPELLTGAPYDSTLNTLAGAVFLNLSPQVTSDFQTSAQIILGEQAYGVFGTNVTSEDFTLVAGEPGYSDGARIEAGAVYGFDARTLAKSNTTADADFIIKGESYLGLGQNQLFADLDSDGLAELFVSGYLMSAVYVFDQLLSGDLTLADSQTQLIGEKNTDSFGKSLAVFDSDEDGYNDVAVGAPLHETKSSLGGVYLFNGPFTPGVVNASEAEATLSNAGFFQNSFGEALSILDHNQDEQKDVLVGAPSSEDPSKTSYGAALLFLSPLLGYTDNPNGEYYTYVQNDLTANTLAAGFDINGDGLGDLAIGAMGYDNLAKKQLDVGALYLFVVVP